MLSKRNSIHFILFMLRQLTINVVLRHFAKKKKEKQIKKPHLILITLQYIPVDLRYQTEQQV